MSAETLLGRLDGVRPRGRDRWRARCPVCGGDNATKLSIALAPSGATLVHCFSCGASGPQVCEALGVDPSELFPEKIDDRERKPRGMGAFSARQALIDLDDSALFVAISARALADGGVLTNRVCERLADIAGKIHKARLACGLGIARKTNRQKVCCEL